MNLPIVNIARGAVQEAQRHVANGNRPAAENMLKLSFPRMPQHAIDGVLDKRLAVWFTDQGNTLNYGEFVPKSGG